MSLRSAISNGDHPFHRIASVVLGMLLTAGLCSLLASASAAAQIDPMREAEPAPRFEGLPDIAPPKGKLIPPPTGRGGAGVSVTRGGMQVPNVPQIAGVACVKQCISTRRATPGSVIRVTGGYLGSVVGVVFRGRNNKWIRKKWRARRAVAVRAVVPKRAVKGEVFVVDRFGTRSNRSPKPLGIGPVSAIPKEVFPIRGPFNFGSGGSRFGAGRSGHRHQGQDMGASCGTKLVSVRKGRVAYNAWHSAAGNYVVIKNSGTNTSFVYMHMKSRSKLKVGQMVGAGTAIGRVGNTGSSSGCHLHFEYWIGPWQTGGKPIDPLKYLKSLRRK